MTRLNARRRISIRRSSGRGQGLVEFALLVPVFMLILLGLLEFGMVFDHTMTITTATREGARNGAAFAKGNTTTMICTTSVDVDKFIIAAVQRVLKAPGSQIVLRPSTSITIYKSAADGTVSGGLSNTWTYSPSAGNPVVDSTPLDFAPPPGNAPWNACTRSNGGATPDSLGVSISYQYKYVTPLAAVLGFFGPAGSGGLTITDHSVMSLNPTN
jgi:Flp pilus assembly protein TadG